jgi:uncharacterized protein
MTAASLHWLLADFARETPGVTRALVVSADGLRLATSPGMSDELGDQLSAAASGLVSLAMATGYLFVTTIDRGGALAVHADRNCDIGLIGYEMTMLASRAGHALTPGVRSGTGL